MYFEYVVSDTFGVFCHNALLKKKKSPPVKKFSNKLLKQRTGKKRAGGESERKKKMTKGEVCSRALISSHKFYFQIASLSNALSCTTIDHFFFPSAFEGGVLRRGNSGHLSRREK